MLYNNKQELLQLLNRENLFTEKKLGQNFMFNTAIIEKILTAAELTPDDRVVEVGPGLGILTAELLKRAGFVTTIELDTKLIPYLERTFAEDKNLKILHQDVLESTLPSTPYKLIANIPYYITSPILSHFLQLPPPRKTTTDSNNPDAPIIDRPLRPTTIVLLVQLEVAQKICAQTGDHTVISLQTQIFGKPKIISKVAPGNFHPAPNVDSAILKIDVYPEPLVKNPDLFIGLIKKAFSMKRKTLLNSLESWHNLDRTQTATLLEKSGINPMQRPQNLTITDFEKICENSGF